MQDGSEVEPTARSGAVALSAELAAVDDETAVVSARGELDRVTADQLKGCLRRALNDGAKYLCIDLLEVDYMDSSGFGPMIEAYHGVQGLGGAITVVCREILCELFEVTGLAEVFALRHRREDGLAYLSSCK